MKLKETLNLGKTAFPMRAGLPNKEPIWQKEWEDAKMYQRRQELNQGKPHFTLHDGPPYANGNIHVGHAMNKISKDIIVRSKSMSGFYAPYVPGWDTHGLPIEQVLAKQGVKRKELDRAEYLKMCRDYALSQVDKQREDFKRLGVSADWDNPYVTLTPDYEAAQIRVFGEMAKKGYIYQGAKPVYWSWSSESALAEAEIEYHDLVSTSLYYANKVKDGKGVLDTDTYIVVWTTTPFTVTASRGLTVGADIEYVLVKPAGENRKFVVASELLNSLSEKFGWTDVEVLQSYRGEELNQIVTEHPWDTEVDELVILGDHVTTDSGTGIVHTAPGFGEDDYNVGIANGLEVAVTVNERGIMMENAGPDFEGQFYDKVAPIVMEKLGDLLLAKEEISHSYPFDWRTKKPIIWRAVPQWFASVSKFRQEILDEIEKVKFHSEWGKVRLYNMIRDRGDWVISRQRAWGVPLPIFYAEDKTPIMTEETIEHVAKLFEEHGSVIWWERDAKDLLPEGFTHPGSPNGEFTKETDIMDVWFDSGSSHTGVLVERGLGYPADLYFEGSDQYRGWFNSSLIIGTAVHGKAPYKTVLSHGFTLDGKGLKMSKSGGNAVDPIKTINKWGADILRLWATTVDFQSDVRISDDILKKVSESYRKVRNTMRFLLGNLNDFKDTDVLPVNELEPVDQYMLAKLNDLMDAYHKSMDSYNFSEANKEILNYFTNTLSAFYMDFTKDILYIEKADSTRRRQVQTVLYHHAKTMMKLISPILVFTAEELHDHFHCDAKQEESVFLEAKPEKFEIENADALKEQFDLFMNLRTDVMKSLENLRAEKVINSNMEGKLTITLKDEYKSLASLEDSMKQLFIVAKVTLDDNAEGKDEYETCFIKAEKFHGVQCPRCWNWFEEGELVDGLCPRCHEVVETLPSSEEE